MPIREEHRFFYPIDRRELSAVIRFGRANGRCEACGRPHGRTVFCLDDGRWWDEEAASWRDGSGRIICTPDTGCKCQICLLSYTDPFGFFLAIAIYDA